MIEAKTSNTEVFLVDNFYLQMLVPTLVCFLSKRCALYITPCFPFIVFLNESFFSLIFFFIRISFLQSLVHLLSFFMPLFTYILNYEEYWQHFFL